MLEEAPNLLINFFLKAPITKKWQEMPPEGGLQNCTALVCPQKMLIEFYSSWAPPRNSGKVAPHNDPMQWF